MTEAPAAGAPHEARSLSLAIDRARHVLGWHPRLSFEETLDWVNQGYVAPLAPTVREQIALYHRRLTA